MATSTSSRRSFTTGTTSATAILRTIRAAAPENARLLLLESIVPAGNEPDGVKWLDLLMLPSFTAENGVKTSGARSSKQAGSSRFSSRTG